jgi:hypothetical protein
MEFGLVHGSTMALALAFEPLLVIFIPQLQRAQPLPDPNATGSHGAALKLVGGLLTGSSLALGHRLCEKLVHIHARFKPWGVGVQTHCSGALFQGKPQWVSLLCSSTPREGISPCRPTLSVEYGCRVEVTCLESLSTDSS